MARKIAVLMVVFLSASRVMVMNGQQAQHAPDGGVRETLISIAVPPLPNAPFSATVQTEWTKFLADGTTQLIQNHRLIARDGLGRVFQERAMLAPKGNPIESQIVSTELAEPSSHTIARCDARTRICELRPYVGPPATASAGAVVNRPGFVSETLGSQVLNGLDLIGTRETQTLNPLATGSDRPIVVVKEFWYSRQLGLNVLTTRNDPRSGKEVFTVTEIRQGEPDASLFALPAGFRIVDLRGAALAR